MSIGLKEDRRNSRGRVMKPSVVMAFSIAVFAGLSVMTLPGAAQTVSVSPSAQSPTPQSGQAGLQPSLPSAGVPAAVASGQTSALSPAVSPIVGSGSNMAFGTAGRGLPGMPGGPPLNAPMGAQDPSGRYMRPPVVGPLFCDPSLNIACE
jgi:hypothetical protein